MVMACAGDVTTLETLAAVAILRAQLPDLKIRVVNVVDLMTKVLSGEDNTRLLHVMGFQCPEGRHALQLRAEV